MTVLPRIVSSLGPSNNASTPPKLPTTPLCPVVLHFDINETIMLGDEAGDDTLTDSIHKLVAKSAFVRIPEEFYKDENQSLNDTNEIVPTHWWDGTPLSSTESTHEGDRDHVPPLYTGWEWPPQCCPYYRTAYKKHAKRFVEHHGWCYRGLYDRVDGIMTEAHDHLPPVLAQILPSFFKSLAEFEEKYRNEDGDEMQCRIVFRTFGTDLENIAEAMTLFATGKHPDFPDFVQERFVLKPTDLARGRWQEQGDGSFTYNLYTYDGKQKIASGDEEVLQWLERKSICGIRDDYSFWSTHGFQPWAGKPIWATTTAPQHHEHHILLDDNIHNPSGKSIAGVRYQDAITGTFRTMSGDEVQAMQGIHLIRVPTIEPLLDPKWFLEQIGSARRKYAAG